MEPEAVRRRRAEKGVLAVHLARVWEMQRNMRCFWYLRYSVFERPSPQMRPFTS